VIFEVIGSPTEEDRAFVTDQKALEYLDAFPTKPRIELANLYPGAGDDGIDLLNRMLNFNPYFRITIEECLEHPFFKKVRKPAKEVAVEKEIQIDFEKEALDKKKLRNLFLEEVNIWKVRNADEKPV
jgi:serine/threonine protein kinase